MGNARWFTADEAQTWGAKSKWLVREVGWIIRETKQHILFASSWKVEDDYTVEQWGGLHKVPTTWIRNRKVIKL